MEITNAGRNFITTAMIEIPSTEVTTAIQSTASKYLVCTQSKNSAGFECSKVTVAIANRIVEMVAVGTKYTKAGSLERI